MTYGMTVEGCTTSTHNPDEDNMKSAGAVSARRPIRSAVHYPLPPRAERPITVRECARGSETPRRRAHSGKTIIRPLPRVVSQRRITGVPHHTTPGTRGAGHPIQLHSHQVAPREMPPGGLHSLEFKPLCALTISPFGWRSHLPCGPGLSTGK